MAPLAPLSARALLESAAAALHPTRTLPHLLHIRQTETNPDGGTVTVITGTNDNNDDNDPDDAQTLTGGAIAGIVIGSVAGFLLLVWIIRSCTNLGAPPSDEGVPGRPWYGDVRAKRYSPPGGSGGGRSRSSRRASYGHSLVEHPSRGYRQHHHHHHHHLRGDRRRSVSRGRSRSVSRVSVPVQEVRPVAVVRDGASRSRSRGREYYRYGGEGLGRGYSRGYYD